MELEHLFTFNRRISLKLVPFFMRTPLTPNHITTLSLLSGITCGFCMAGGTRISMIAGAFFLQLSFILDNCDGEIARLKSLKSRLGMWYDFCADLLVDISLWVGLGLGATTQGESGNLCLLLTLIATIGSVINFLRVTGERQRGISGKDSWNGRSHPVLAAFYSLSHDGDPTLLVWAAVLLFSPIVFLFAGAIYIHTLWLGGVMIGFKKL